MSRSSWERSIDELIVVLEQDNFHLTDDDCQRAAALIRQSEVCRETLEKLVQGCQYIGPSHRDSDGMTEVRYEGAAALTKEQWTLVELFMGDL